MIETLIVIGAIVVGAAAGLLIFGPVAYADWQVHKRMPAELRRAVNWGTGLLLLTAFGSMVVLASVGFGLGGALRVALAWSAASLVLLLFAGGCVLAARRTGRRGGTRRGQ